MEKPKEYTVCTAIGTQAISEMVNSLINAGWIPHGSVSSVSYQIKEKASLRRITELSQAMVKY